MTLPDSNMKPGLSSILLPTYTNTPTIYRFLCFSLHLLYYYILFIIYRNVDSVPQNTQIIHYQFVYCIQPAIRPLQLLS